MVQIKRYTRRIRKEVMPAKTWVTSFGRTSKAPSKIIEPPIKVKRKTRLTNIVIPKGKGIPLWKIKGVLQNINQMSTLDIRALHKLLFHEIANKKESIYHILDFNGFEKPSTKIVLRSAMSKYNIRFLKRACKLFSLPARKEKAALVDMLIDFFHIPYQPIKYQPTRQFIYHTCFNDAKPLESQLSVQLYSDTAQKVKKEVVKQEEFKNCTPPKWAIPVVSIDVILRRMKIEPEDYTLCYY